MNRVFTKIRYLAIAMLSVLFMSGCGQGTCPPSNGSLSLSISAPSQYPAGNPTSITAYLTITNDSNVAATNLFFTIPDSTNYTGVPVTVVNGAGNPCYANVAAHSSCTFPVTIAPNANPGSFTVAVTPNSSSLTRAEVKTKSLLGLNSDTIYLTATIGLSNIPPNNASGANGITFLYPQTVASNPDGSTVVSIIALVQSASAGAFNTINLTNPSGNPLIFTPLSGNSGNGQTNLAQGQIVTFTLTIPKGETSYTFYGQTMENGTVVDIDSGHTINLVDSTYGVLSIQPNNLNLSKSYESQIMTYTNTGNGDLTGLTFPVPTPPLSLTNNTCTSILSPGQSCTVTLVSNAANGTSGSGSYIVTYNNPNGSGVSSSVSNYNYAGASPESGVTLSGDFAFTTTTVTNESIQVTLTNTGNVAESNFAFTVPQYFALTAGTSGTPCTLSGNTVTDTLAVNASCTLTLTYSTATVVSSTAPLSYTYTYNGNLSGNGSQTLTYQTTQATASLQSTPISPFTFNTIIANGLESQTQVFTIENNGPDTISSALTITPSGDSAFTLLPSSGVGDCRGMSSLAVGGTCTFSVRFGTTLVESNNATATYSISGTSTTGGTISSNVVVNGNARAPLSANISVYQVIASDYSSGGNGESLTTAFAFESTQATSSASITLSYKNTGTTSATNFTVNTTTQLPSGYIASSNGCNGITLAINATCEVVLQPSVSTPGNLPIVLSTSSLSGTWTDERGQQQNQAVLWTPNGAPSPLNTIYVNIFAASSIVAVMSSDSGGLNQIESVNVESTFYYVFTLSGGYNVQNTTYTVTVPDGFTTPNGATCQVSSLNATCYVEVISPSEASSGNTITVSGNPTPSPSTFSVDVVVPVVYPAGCTNGNKCIFVTSTAAIVGSNFTGYSGADSLCTNDSNNPFGAGNGTWKALLWGNNSTTSGVSYYQANGSNVTLIATATGGDLVGANPTTNPFTSANRYVWTGAVGGDCSTWSSNSGNTQFGNTATTAYWYYSNGTTTSCAYTLTYLMCVQQ